MKPRFPFAQSAGRHAGLLLSLISPLTAAAPTPLEPPHWETQGPVIWEQTDAGISASGGAPEPGYLVSHAAYGPLRLRLAFWIEPDTNSGVFISCAPDAPISPNACYEINLWDEHPNQSWRTGSLVGLAPPLARVETLGRWNRLEILAEEKRLRVWINDTLTADRLIEAPRPGHLALQFGGTGAVRFRDLALEQP